MKKSLVFILIFCFSLSLASAFYTEPTLLLQKTNFQEGETLLGTIEGNFVQKILPSQVHFYERKREIFFEFNLLFYNGTHYLYAYMEKEGNFSMNISNVLYKDGALKSKSLSQEIKVKTKIDTIIENNVSKNVTKILSVKPGFIYTSLKPEITISNRGNSAIEVEFEKEKINLSASESRKIYPTVSEGVNIISLNSYENFKIPVIYFSLLPPEETTLPPQQNQTQNNTNATTPASYGLKISPLAILKNLTEGGKIAIPLEIINLANAEIKSLRADTNLSSLKVLIGGNIKPNESLTGNITFSPAYPGFFKGEIVITYDAGELARSTIPYEFYVLPKNTTISIASTGKNCVNLNGKICVNQKCIGNYTFTSFGEYCCLGTCQNETKQSSGSYNWLIGLLIFVVLGFFGFLIWQKYKKAKPKAPEQVMQKKTNLFEKRVQGGLSRS